MYFNIHVECMVIFFSSYLSPQIFITIFAPKSVIILNAFIGKRLHAECVILAWLCGFINGNGLCENGEERENYSFGAGAADSISGSAHFRFLPYIFFLKKKSEFFFKPITPNVSILCGDGNSDNDELA